MKRPYALRMFTDEEIDRAVDAFAQIPASSSTFVAGGAVPAGETPMQNVPNSAISVFQGAGNLDCPTPRVAFAMEGSDVDFQAAAQLRDMKRFYAYLTPEDAITLARRLIKAAGDALAAAQGLDPTPLPGTNFTDSESP